MQGKQKQKGILCKLYTFFSFTKHVIANQRKEGKKPSQQSNSKR